MKTLKQLNESRTTLKATNGQSISFDTKAIKSLEKNAIAAYNNSVEFEKGVKGLTGMKALKFEKSFQGEKDFQHYTSHYVVSYKKNLINGVFKGHKFQLQFLKDHEGVKAGTIVKW